MYVEICIQMNLFNYKMYISSKRHELIGYSQKLAMFHRKKKIVIKFIKAAAVLYTQNTNNNMTECFHSWRQN